MLLDRATRKDADLAELDRIVDLGPGQLLVPILFRRATGHIISFDDKTKDDRQRSRYVALFSSGRGASSAMRSTRCMLQNPLW